MGDCLLIAVSGIGMVKPTAEMDFCFGDMGWWLDFTVEESLKLGPCVVVNDDAVAGLL
jgi:hypothetical protein